MPVPTIAWLSWHIGWWWGVTQDHLAGRTPRERDEVRWPGPDKSVAWLRDLREGWSEATSRSLDLDAAAPFPWPEGSGMTVADTDSGDSFASYSATAPPRETPSPARARRRRRWSSARCLTPPTSPGSLRLRCALQAPESRRLHFAHGENPLPGRLGRSHHRRRNRPGSGSAAHRQ
ncbi:DinB family protein [Nocardiopsis sp. CNR-923]|uniref:DinB family protein n=1 Tax=Nocardiopsis sp. CNR-923 TaxID=1904965 RepID=UPI00096A950D|nr:DinB family protein [Nocardiopsis sp. CNR-923]